ncbi:hypothetical protein [Ancylobacter sp.]|uniref:hypothetical protein n=1 Tax=Ancylobacter sp. TaxID=1872567 RepID=UPI003C7C3126
MVGWIKKLWRWARERQERLDLSHSICLYRDLVRDIDKPVLDEEYLIPAPDVAAIRKMSIEELRLLNESLSKPMIRAKCLRAELESKGRAVAKSYRYELHIKGLYSDAYYHLSKASEDITQRDRDLIALVETLHAYNYVDKYAVWDVYRGVLMHGHTYRRYIQYKNAGFQQADEVRDREWFQSLMEPYSIHQAYANTHSAFQDALKQYPHSRRLKRLQSEFIQKGVLNK